MTTINYATVENAAAGYTQVEWAGLASGDDGQIFDCAGLELASVQTFGSFGGTMKVEGSNEVTPSSFSEVYSTGGNDMVGYEPGRHMKAIRPVFSGGGAGTGKVALFLHR